MWQQNPQTNRFEAVFASILDAVFIYDRHGFIIENNPSARKMFHMDEYSHYEQIPFEERLRKLHMKQADGSTYPEEEWPLRRVLRGEVFQDQQAKDVVIQNFHGQDLYLSITGSPLRDEQGDIIGAVLVFRDVTDRLLLEKRVWQQEFLHAQAKEMAQVEINRHFDEFLSIASHELRTPLTTIGGNVQLALRRLAVLQEHDAPAASPLAKKLERIQSPLISAYHRVNVQNRMISDLLDVSRIKTNQFALAITCCDLVSIVRRTIEDQSAVMPERAIVLEVSAPGAVTVMADADRIAQVIDNYLSNALKFSPLNTPILVSLDVKLREARVCVHDEGPGLASEDQQQIWERFHRNKHIHVQDTVDGSGNLGLGLYICRTIIEHHSGRYGVESELGKGSTFWFTLPLAP
jgi:signal transduction histidine kinase